jgi:sugar phosphate isomerase/epimerase
MKLQDGAHLTYCTNIHRGETWDETHAALERYLPEVRRKIAADQRMGVGMRLSAIAAEELARPEMLERFRDFLARNDLYVFTINGFPYGPFHGTRVKEDVYQPDWRFAERLAYSNRLADILLELIADEPDLDGSISTVPATFGPFGRQPGSLPAISKNLLKHVAHLIRLREASGRTVTLALEPEPMCYLETTEGAAQFFEDHLYSLAAVTTVAELTGLSRSHAEEAVHRHLGLCFDVCHAAVEFEDAAASFERLNRSGIPVLKVQLSAALRVPNVEGGTVGQLTRFDDGVYLHQVVERRGDGSLVRFLDLGPAFDAVEQAMGNEWRVHCHVPVFHEALPVLATTQSFLREVLLMHKRSPISRHLEVETYTFDVLPEELRSVDVATAVARELAWARDQLSA